MAKILIVDDSEALRTQLREDLESRSHTVLQAFDGLNGLEQVKKNEGIDLIICDVNMPNMDGLSMCAKLSENPEYAKMNIFMLTTEASTEMKARGKTVGVKAWIIKPYALDKLLMAVDRICKK